MWNGWGFIDYGEICNNITSFNSDICQIELNSATFDCVYSVSVIEHMHSHQRKILWNRIGQWVKDSGILLLTLDLIPNTNLLWNYCEGNLVDSSEHGDIDMIHKEVKNDGFVLDDFKVLRLSSDSMTDIAFLCFKKLANDNIIVTSHKDTM